MTSLTHGRGRLARGLTFSAACLFVPATAHVVGGGAIPAAGPFLFAAALLSAACVAMADRRLSACVIAVLMFGSQPLFHILLSLSAQGHGSGVATAGVGMVALHAAAAAVLTVLLIGGEAVLWSMSALSSVLLLRRVRILLFTKVPRYVRPLPRAEHLVVSRSALSILRATPRRGPPVLSMT